MYIMSKTLVNNNNKKDVMIVTGAGQISMAIASYYYGPLQPEK